MEREEILEEIKALNSCIAQFDKLHRYRCNKVDHKFIEFDNNSTEVGGPYPPSVLIYETEAEALINDFMDKLEQMYIDKILVISSNLKQFNF